MSSENNEQKSKSDDKTALIFAERCSNYAKKNIPAEWDGVRTLTSK
jgi:hypothetical protein